MTSEGEFQIGIQFVAKVVPFDVFRLVNLLKQPHSGLYAIIGTAQGALDFRFDEKADQVAVVRAAVAQLSAPAATATESKSYKKTTDVEESAIVMFRTGPTPSKFADIRWNHFPDDPNPFGLFASYFVEGVEGQTSAAGRGTSPTEAAMSLLAQVGIIPTDRKVEPFEAIKYLVDGYPADPYCIALSKVLNTNLFDALLKVQDGAAEVVEKPKRARVKKEPAELEAKGE